MFDFLSKFFGRETSSATAKERLRLVLLSDHLSLAPDVVEALKRDLVAVISRYVEVDAENCDVSFEQQDKHIAMLANIPVLGMDRRTPPPAPPSNGSADAPPGIGNAAGASAAVAIELEPDVTVTPAPAPSTSSGQVPSTSSGQVPSTSSGQVPSTSSGQVLPGGASRRKRRKRRNVGMNASPQPG